MKSQRTNTLIVKFTSHKAITSNGVINHNYTLRPQYTHARIPLVDTQIDFVHQSQSR